MGYFILWIENLAASLLLVALLAACVARRRAKWDRPLLAALVFLLPLLGFLFLTAVDAAIEQNNRLGWFWPLVILTLAYAVGGLAICWQALRRAEPAGPGAGAAWSRGRLAVALVVVVALAGMTFMSIDASVKQNLAQVRTETVALVLSVAPQRVPDRQNAAILYQQAFEAVPALEAWPEVFHDAIEATDPDQVEADAGSAPFDFKDAKLAEFLKSHAGLLATIRAAAAMPDCYFDHDYTNPRYDMLLPEIQSLRNLSRFLAVDARRAPLKATHGRRWPTSARCMGSRGMPRRSRCSYRPW